MCGIAGIVGRRGRPPASEVLERLADAMGHRGPDGRGRYVSGTVGLVHTRLAIVDLETGDQPLFSHADADEDDTTGGERWVALVANGEIYNDPMVRAEFGAEHFATRSDCESPLVLYQRYGLSFADHLRGMYAIALHDPGVGDAAAKPSSGRVVLARDPFGIKPLYYAETDAGFAFASEPQALIHAGVVEPVLRRPARDELLQLRFTTGRPTVFAGISRVLPGETIVVEDGRITEVRRREALPEGGPDRVSEAAARTALDATLIGSVDVHQRADVAYGLFLSGGIDSAAVLAAMARLNDAPVAAFTVGFESDRVHDERAAARTVAKAARAEHVEVTFSERDFWELLPAVAAILDDPTADYAALPSYLLARAARAAGIKVVLTGEGGDELFAGYGRYRRAIRPKLLGGRKMRHRGVFDGLDILADGSGWRDGLDRAEAAAATPGRTALQAHQAADVAEWLPNDLLIKLDRCLMAHGVEGRVPLIDPEVARLAFKLPDGLKVGGGLGKRVLRSWLAEHMPAAQPFAAKKGFTVPVAEWIGRRGGALGRLVATQPGVAQACRPGTIEPLFEAATGNEKAGQAAWVLLFFALWHQCHIVGVRDQGDVFATLAA